MPWGVGSLWARRYSPPSGRQARSQLKADDATDDDAADDDEEEEQVEDDAGAAAAEDEREDGAAEDATDDGANDAADEQPPRGTADRMAGEEQGDDDADVATDDLAQPNKPRFPIYGSRLPDSYCYVPTNYYLHAEMPPWHPAGITALDATAGRQYNGPNRAW